LEEERMSDVRGRRMTRWAAALALALVLLAAIATASVAKAHSVSTRLLPLAGGSRADGTSAGRLRSLIADTVRSQARTLPALSGPVGSPSLQTRIAGTPCGETPGLLCSQVDVPLDRTGQVPGTVSLHVETLPAFGVARGTIFLIAGGPGQGSAHVFDLGAPDAVVLYRFLFPGYTLVAYDDRGTGDSGVLRCPGLQTSVSIDVETGLAAACAESLGAQRDFYSTHEHAEDLEAVRQFLGADKVALWGTSYGTKLALAYALAHPDHVERLLLDSVVPPELPDPYEGNVLKQLPGTLSAFCAGGLCKSATADFAGDVVTVANRLAAKPIEIKVLQSNGSRKVERINGLALLSVVVDADLSPGLAAELPAATHAARVGNYGPLLRLFELDTQGSIVPDEELSSGLFAATVCRDGPFPWQPTTPITDRPSILSATLKALPAGTLGPFGTWAAGLGNATFCLRWPVPTGGAALGPGPLPDVPVLAVSGGFDMRTPTPGANDVASRFPQGRVLVVPGVGHSVLGADTSFCSQQAVHDWILGNQPATSCARPQPIVDLVPAYPAPPGGKKTASPARTLAIATQALRDAEAIFLMAAPGQKIAGVSGGKLIAAERRFTLTRYSVTPGFELSGKIRVGGTGLPLKFQGAVTVSGAAAATGLLGISANKVGGTLGGAIVGS
jgi:pimeloyl-ACP methyl ester carboxylesterase